MPLFLQKRNKGGNKEGRTNRQGCIAHNVNAFIRVVCVCKIQKLLQIYSQFSTYYSLRKALNSRTPWDKSYHDSFGKSPKDFNVCPLASLLCEKWWELMRP